MLPPIKICAPVLPKTASEPKVLKGFWKSVQAETQNPPFHIKTDSESQCLCEGGQGRGLLGSWHHVFIECVYQRGWMGPELSCLKGSPLLKAFFTENTGQTGVKVKRLPLALAVHHTLNNTWWWVCAECSIDAALTFAKQHLQKLPCCSV